MKCRAGIFILVFCLLPGLFVPVCAVNSPNNTATSAILMDLESGRILYHKNENEQRMIASITKLMTALVAVEATEELDQPVKIMQDWTAVEGSSLYLKPGEVLTMKTLLYGLLLHSGNDAAVAIAGTCAGDVETFVEWMNQKAADLGMENTHFANPNGLNDENHYSTAADMARLAAACMENETIAQIVATKSISLEGRSFVNHNKLLWRYKGCVGMKTGYTDKAGRTLISAAQRDGQTLVVVTLNDPDDWTDHENLFDYGFAAYPCTTFCCSGQRVRSVKVSGSLVRSVPVKVLQTLMYPCGKMDQVEALVELPEQVEAPVTEGDIAGRLVFYLDGKVIGESDLVYAATATRDTVAASDGVRRILDFFRKRQQEGFTDAFRMLRLEL